MSASSKPTLAPESCSEAARLTATVDLPTPPLPEATAMACLTPGMACSPARPPNEGRMLAVIFRSTAVTPGSPLTSSVAMVWNRSRTGHAGVVSSNVKLTFPPSEMLRSLIIPRLTTSRPRSGSLIADRTERTWSLLGTEDHRGPQREHAEQDQHRHDHCVDADPRQSRRSTRAQHPHVTSGQDQRCGDAGDGESPQGEPGQEARQRPCGSHRDEEDDDQRKLERREVAARLVQPSQAECRLGPVTHEKRDERRGAAQARREKQTAERPCVAPHRLVADAEQDARVGGDEDPERGADDVEQAIQK